MTCQKTVPAQGDTLFAAELRYNSGLVRPGSVPLYAGNISEWQWQNADGRTHTYSFSYDASGRLTGSALFSEGNADGSFTEGGIIYDRNGNIIGLTRTNGEDEFAKGFAYQGNMLKSLCGKDETSGEYLYDGSGNMTHDGNNGLDLEYNRMNLMQKVTRKVLQLLIIVIFTMVLNSMLWTAGEKGWNIMVRSHTECVKTGACRFRRPVLPAAVS